MLILPIQKKWFDMIAEGIKREEYREIKPYWDSRLGNYYIGQVFDKYKKIGLKRFTTLGSTILFRNGYSLNSPHLECECALRIGQGKPEWGAEPNKEYYILEILEVVDGNNRI